MLLSRLQNEALQTFERHPVALEEIVLRNRKALRKIPTFSPNNYSMNLIKMQSEEVRHDGLRSQRPSALILQHGDQNEDCSGVQSSVKLPEPSDTLCVAISYLGTSL